MPGLLTVITRFTGSPTSTCLGVWASITSSGLVATVRAEAWALKWTLATLPISPSSMGITCSSTLRSSPGGIVPSDQTSSPPWTPCDACGLVLTNRVPLGISSWISTPCAAIWPALRTLILNVAGLPTWISAGAVFSTVTCGDWAPSSCLLPGIPVPPPAPRSIGKPWAAPNRAGSPASGMSPEGVPGRLSAAANRLPDGGKLPACFRASGGKRPGSPLAPLEAAGEADSDCVDGSAEAGVEAGTEAEEGVAGSSAGMEGGGERSLSSLAEPPVRPKADKPFAAGGPNGSTAGWTGDSETACSAVPIPPVSVVTPEVATASPCAAGGKCRRGLTWASSDGGCGFPLSTATSCDGAIWWAATGGGASASTGVSGDGVLLSAGGSSGGGVPPSAGVSGAGGRASAVASGAESPPTTIAGVAAAIPSLVGALLAGTVVEGALTPRCACAMAITPSTTTVTNTEIRITRRFMASFSW